MSRATGTIQVGSQLVMARTLPSGRAVITRYRVVAVQPGVEYRTRSAVGGESSFSLNPIDSGTRTEVVRSTSAPGYVAWLPWLVAALTGKNWAKYVRARFDGVNQAPKRRTEQAPKYRAEQDPGTT